MKAIGILWNSMNKYTDMALNDINKFCKITDVISINFNELFSDFISKVYPYTGENLWKLKYKISHMDNIYESNEIKIVFLDIPSTEKIFVERKGIYIYKNVEELKNYIRNKYRNKVDNYAFDNVFHMTDDEKEYEETLKLVINYIINYFNINKHIFDLDEILYIKPEYFDKSLGKRNKLFLFDNQIIFKEKKAYSLENFSEVFCYHFFKKLDINNAEYYFSKYKNVDGVVTNNFINSEEIFIDGTKIIDAYLTYVETGKVKFNTENKHDIEFITRYNNIDDLKRIFEYFSSIYNIDLNIIINSLKKIFVIDLLFFQSDRNPYNWGILINKTNNRAQLAPLYDNSNIFNFNKPDVLIKMIKNKDNEKLIYSLAMENNPTLLQLHKGEDLFMPKSLLIENIDDDEIIQFMKELIKKIDSYGLENLVNEIINDFPKKMENNMFKNLIIKLLNVNISLIKEKLSYNKIKLFK